MASLKQRLIRATDLLSQFFDLPTTDTVASQLALSNLTGNSNNTKSKSVNDIRYPNKLELELNNALINTTDGALLTKSLINRINSFIVPGAINNLPDTAEPNAINKLIQIYFNDSDFLNGTDANSRPSINSMLGATQGQDSVINSNSSDPTKEKPNLSIILSNSMRVSLEQRNVDSVSIFMNGMPNLELARAVPFVNIQFFFPEAPADADRKIQGLSLVKFLEGAKKIKENSAESMMVDGSSVRAAMVTPDESAREKAPIYTTAGMELLTAPQVLVNADTIDDPSLRSTSVLDKFRPLMSLISLEITIVPTKGIMSNKSGTMVLKLHDRSRLAEVANFIKPDSFDTTEMMIEYGWHHPDGGNIVGADNPYGDLVNGMRHKDKFNIVNSSFSFSPNGEVDITIQIMAQGALTFDTQLISSNDANLGNTMKEIEELQSLIAKLRNKLFPGGDNVKHPEVRGVQILEAAQDATSNLTVTPELRKSMRDLKASFSKSTNPDATILEKALNDLFGSGIISENGKKPAAGKVGLVRKSILDDMNDKLKKLIDSGDPFMLPGQKIVDNNSELSGTKGRLLKNADKWRAVEKKNLEPTGLYKTITNNNNSSVSLAKLVLFFIGQPLANSKQFDEVQIIFYPFNECAGTAHSLNIGNFVVDLVYFTDQFYRYRTEHISKSGNMSLSQFLAFITDIILDDPAAPCYGLNDESGGFYEIVTKDGQIKTQQADEEPTFQERLNKKLKGLTPGGVWKMPQIKFFIESLTEDTGSEDGKSLESTNGKTIVRVHVFDQVSSNYSSIGSLLQSARENDITKIMLAGKDLDDNSGTDGVSEARKNANAAVLTAAEQEQFLQKVNPNSPDSTYVLRGNSRQLKNFIQRSMPYIIYGAAGSTITNAKLTSQQNSKLNTVMLLRSWSKGTSKPNGEDPGGLPMRIIPTQLEISMLGCPLLNFAQSFYVDFQTGTSADNIYNVTGITHNFSPGSYTTEIKMAPGDAYGNYVGLLDKIKDSLDIVKTYNAAHKNDGSIPTPTQELGDT